MPFLGTYSRDLKTYIHTNTYEHSYTYCSQVRGNNPNACELIDGWRNKRWYIYTMEYYQKQKRMNMDEVENITLYERSQIQKTTYCMISYIWNSRKGKTMMTESRSVVSLSAEWKQRELTAKGHEEILGLKWNVHMIVVVVIQLYTLVKRHQTEHSKLVNFILCKLCFSKGDF